MNQIGQSIKKLSIFQNDHDNDNDDDDDDDRKHYGDYDNKDELRCSVASDEDDDGDDDDGDDDDDDDDDNNVDVEWCLYVCYWVLMDEASMVAKFKDFAKHDARSDRCRLMWMRLTLPET